MKVNTDRGEIEEFLERGVAEIYPDKAFLMKRMSEGKRLSMYLGIDPTGPTLHVGHSIALKKLGQFQKLGHRAILLIGDFTAMIGDPSGRSQARVRLSREKVMKNAEKYREQASIFLDFEGENSAELKYNSEWLSNMNFEEVLGLSSKMTVDQMLKRDMFEKRKEEGKPIYIHEFLYPLMQGYDAVAMEVDGEIGGTDQTFNMLVGRTLMKDILEKEKFVMTTKLLEDPTGGKMGKTEGNMITFEDEPFDMFGKVMSWSDEMILPGLELCSQKSSEEIAAMEERLKGGENPKDIKLELAEFIVSIYHGEEEARKAKGEFKKVFSEGGLPKDVQKAETEENALLADVLVREGVVSSKSEFRRLQSEGAVKIIEKGEERAVEDPGYTITEAITVRIGKRRFIEIVPK